MGERLKRKGESLVLKKLGRDEGEIRKGGCGEKVLGLQA